MSLQAAAALARRALPAVAAGAVLAAWMLLLCAAPAAAQASPAGIIAGTVRGQDAAPVVDASVIATFADGSYERRGTTDSEGRFRLGALPPGSYHVSVRRLGYRPVITTGVTVAASNVTAITVTLQATPLDLAPVVVAQQGAEPGRETEVSPVRVDAQQIADLPVGLDLNRLVALTPGARPDQMWGGAGVQANAYRLDGVGINHPGLGGAIFQPNVAWIQELDVRGLGAGADQGGFQGGLVDVVTKSGTNTRRNHMSVAYENEALNATNLSGTDIVPELAGRKQVNLDLSGPIVRDRLFYFFGSQWLRTQQRALDHLGNAPFSPVQEIADTRSAFGKLTWTPSTSDLANLGIALADSATDHAGLTGRETADATSRVRARTLVLDGSWQHTLGRQTILEAKAVSLHGLTNDDPYLSTAIPGVATYQLGTSRSYQNAAFVQRQQPTSVGYTLTADHFVHWLGDHHLRVGTEQVFGRWNDDRTRTAGMTWRPRDQTPAGTPAAFDPANAMTWPRYIPSGWGGETHVHARVRNGAAFLQDDYTIGRIGIHPGLRYGWWSGFIRPAGGGPEIHAITASGLDPRIGLTADLGTRTHPVALTVHWGRYHQDLFSSMYDRVAGANAYSNYEIWEYLGPAFADPTTTFTVTQRDSLAALGQFRQIELDQLDQSGVVHDYHQPYVDQFVVGLRMDPTPTIHWSAAYIQRDNRNIVALVDRNAATNYVVADSVGMLDRWGRWVADFRDGSQVLILPKVYIPKNAVAAAIAAGFRVPASLSSGGELTFDPEYEITNPTGAERHFHQLLLDVTVDHDTWQWSGSIAWSQLRGNFSTVSGYDPASLTGWDRLVGRGPGPWVRPNEAINFYGDLDNASHVVYKLRLWGLIGRGFRSGAVVNIISGDRLTPTFTIQPYTYDYFGYADRAGGGRLAPQPDTLTSLLFLALAGQRINLVPLGSYHYASHGTLDVHVEHDVRAPGVTWTVAVDVFNALGTRQITLINTSVDASTDPNSATQFRSPLGRVPPRTVRLGLSAVW